mmetsp:Transcript_6517/g.3688  ORF Transcript_6517/g.3688 Transcript_6517/m.3688 type:complete len:81 (+) Transcript_6517:49-291(+)
MGRDLGVGFLTMSVGCVCRAVRIRRALVRGCARFITIFVQIIVLISREEESNIGNVLRLIFNVLCREVFIGEVFGVAGSN